MRLKGVLITFVVLVGLLFAFLNWQALFSPVPVNLLVTTVQLPLGITLLAFALALSLFFLLLSLWERASQLGQVTQRERTIEDLRARLDRQRSVELESLQTLVNDSSDTIRQQSESDSGRVEVNLREALDALESRLNDRLDELEERVVLVRNELAADIGELEDRLQNGPTGEV